MIKRKSGEEQLMRKYYCIKQHDMTDCGAACLATVCRQWGLKTSIAKIREAAGTDTEGTTVYGLTTAARLLGFSTKAVKGDEKALQGKFPLPAIAHMITKDQLMHYVVVHKITAKKVIVADPAQGIVTYSLEAFLKEWTGVLILMVPEIDLTKEEKIKGNLERFFCLLKPQKDLIIQVFIASLIYTVLGIIGAFYIKFLLDDILMYNMKNTLATLSAGILGLYVIQVILNALRSHLLVYLSQKLDIDLLLGYYNHVLKLPVSFFEKRKIGEIISRFEDASHVRNAISSATLTMMIDIIMTIAGGFILYMQSSLLFAIAFAIAALYLMIAILFNQPLKKGNEKQLEDNAQLTSFLVESINGVETIKAFNAEEKISMETERRFIKLLRSIFKLSFTTNIQHALKELIELSGGIIILWVGAYQVMMGNMSVGNLITFNALLVYFLGPVKRLVDLQPNLQTAFIAGDRLSEILDLEIEKSKVEAHKLHPKSFKGDICFRHVNFGYNAKEEVLKDICLQIKAGEKVALVGESGSGKTTLAKLLLHFYTVEKGEILIDQNNISDIDLASLREKTAYVSQDTFLLSGSILENLALGLEKVDLDQIIEASKQAKAHEFINELPLRYETHLEENGSNLSGGQRQRLAIARALVKKPDILILDEATSNLDALTEAAIENTLRQINDEMTCIIIAHRLSTIKMCDKIVVLDKGRIIESGSHEQLMKAQGQYARLWQEQMGGR